MGHPGPSLSPQHAGGECPKGGAKAAELGLCYTSLAIGLLRWSFERCTKNRSRELLARRQEPAPGTWHFVFRDQGGQCRDDRTSG